MTQISNLQAEIVIERAEGLAIGNLVSSNPYAQICIRGCEYSFTRPVFRSLSPVWSGSFEFDGLHFDELVRVVVKDKNKLRDNYLGEVSFTLKNTHGEQVIYDLSIFQKDTPDIQRGVLHIKVIARPSLSSETLIVEKGPVHYAKHVTSAPNFLSGIINKNKHGLCTYQLQLHEIGNTFNFKKQHYDVNYQAIQKIFGPGMNSIAIRKGIQMEHTLLYRHSSRSSEYGVLRTDEDFFWLIGNGRREGKTMLYSYTIDQKGWYFSETGNQVSKNYTSKHTIHAKAQESVYYAGEFYVSEPSEGKWVLVIDNNSGTYNPSREFLPKVKDLILKNFPGMEVETQDKDEPTFEAARKAVLDS